MIRQGPIMSARMASATGAALAVAAGYVAKRRKAKR